MASDSRQPYGEVYDLGYQHYDGPRLGRSHAIRALTLYSIKRGLGIKKKWNSKIMPALLYAAAFIPAIIVAGILAFAPSGLDFSYHNLFQIVSLVVFVFAAALAPEMLSDDRRENVLALYFARSITRFDYLLSKLIAMAILMGTMIYGPALLLYFANVGLARDPIAYFFDHLGDVARIIVSGALIATFLSAIGLSVAAYTNRKGVATGLIIGGAFVLAGIAEALHNALDSDVGDYVIFISPMDLVEAASAWIFDERPQQMARLNGIFHAGAMLVVIGLAAGIMYRRYLAED